MQTLHYYLHSRGSKNKCLLQRNKGRRKKTKALEICCEYERGSTDVIYRRDHLEKIYFGFMRKKHKIKSNFFASRIQIT